MSWISSRKTKFFWWIVHPIQQGMARRTEYPNFVGSCVVAGSPRAITAMFGLVSDIKNSFFSTGLTSAGSAGVPRIKALQIAIWPQLFPRASVVFLNLFRVPGVEPRARFARALCRTFWRAMPLVTLAPTTREKPLPALPAMAACLKQFPRLAVISKFLLASERAELVPSVGRRKPRPALAAIFGAIHA